jgi:perosamine synthetase
MSLKINFSSPVLINKDRKNLMKAYDSGWISQGNYNILLERNFSKILKKKYVLSCSNGTLALHMTLMSLGIKKNDEIIIPSMCYISPAHVISQMNLNIKLSRVNHDNLQIDFDDLVKNITKKTKILILIHNYGNMADIQRIKRLCLAKKIFIIEDFSEAMLSSLNKVYAGQTGDVSFASLHATKTITSGEGGIVATDNKNLYSKLLKIREHGFKNKGDYSYEMIGSNFKMSNLLASIAVSQIKRSKNIIKKKIFILDSYFKHLNNFRKIKFPKFYKNEIPIMWGLPIIFSSQSNLNKIYNKMIKNKIFVKKNFKTLNVYKHLKLNFSKKIKKDENLSKRILILPFHLNLSNQDVLKICKVIKKNL